MDSVKGLTSRCCVNSKKEIKSPRQLSSSSSHDVKLRVLSEANPPALIAFLRLCMVPLEAWVRHKFKFFKLSTGPSASTSCIKRLSDSGVPMSSTDSTEICFSLMRNLKSPIRFRQSDSLKQDLREYEM
mmetsp:Transcript_51733/g.101401  ORF Transcript_51733/g.101401 Transcript_51733/m.101401 type:complete len:129 (+) Transcript_51733:202-588(+)